MVRPLPYSMWPLSSRRSDCLNGSPRPHALGLLHCPPRLQGGAYPFPVLSGSHLSSCCQAESLWVSHVLAIPHLMQRGEGSSTPTLLLATGLSSFPQGLCPTHPPQPGGPTTPAWTPLPPKIALAMGCGASRLPTPKLSLTRAPGALQRNCWTACLRRAW